MVKFEKKWAVVGMIVCILLNILSAIDAISIEGLEIGSLGAATFFLIVYLQVKQQEAEK